MHTFVPVFRPKESCSVVLLLALVGAAAHPSQAADDRIAQALEGMLYRAELEAGAVISSGQLSDNRAPKVLQPAAETSSDPHGSVRKYVEYFTRNGQQHFRAAAKRLAPFQSAFEGIFAAEGIPAELIWLGLVESGYNPNARSPKNAVGMWQFIPETAVRFGLTVRGEDERTDPIKSARAAARYLRFLYGLFGDWKLALAAYNAGEERVSAAMRRAGSRDFWVLSQRGLLPAETRDYVPAVLAAQRLGAEREMTPSINRPSESDNVVYASLSGMD